MNLNSDVINNKSWRVFCAIEIPAEVRRRIAEHITQLKTTVPDAHASWTREDNIHLTLKFLGETPVSAVEELSDAAARATAKVSCFSVRVEGTGAFPERGPARVLWIGIDDAEGRVTHLWRNLEEECAKSGFPKEARPLHPHLTIARLRNPQHARTLAAAHRQMFFEPAEVDVRELLVIRSELGRDGSRYAVISRHPLNPPS